MATQPQETVDDFDAAFASFAAPPAGEPAATVEPTPAADPGPAPAGGDPVEPPVADPAPDGQPGTDPAPDVGDAGGDPGAADPDPAPVAAPTPDNTDELINRLAAMVKDAPASQPVDTSAPEEPAPELYTQEEADFLKTYEADWGDVAKGESLKRKAEYNQMLKYVFQEVAGQLTPLLEQVEVLANRTHLTDLRDKVGDYDTVRDKVIGWVDQQPAYLQVGMKQVIQGGTADEVADLIDRYRKSTGDTAKIPAPTNKTVELSDDAKKAASALAPVDTKRSVIPQGDDPGDFDSAFARFAGQSK